MPKVRVRFAPSPTNRYYLKASPPRRLVELSAPILRNAGYLEGSVGEAMLVWLERLLDATLKNLDYLSQLPAAARQIFEYDASDVVRGQATRHVVEDASSLEVLEAFIPKALAEPEMSYERFRKLAKAAQRETGKKGKELFHPLRVAVTGANSGPESSKS